MEKNDHILMVSLFVVVAIVFLSSIYDDNVTGNTVKNDLELSNCYEENNFKICDVVYPDGKIIEQGHKEETN